MLYTYSLCILQCNIKRATRTYDHLLNKDENSGVDIQNSQLKEQLAMINQLDEDEKIALIKIINSMFTKKLMKDLLDGRIKLAV